MILKDATLSPCGTYRYTLLREWDVALPRALFVLLNPSKADAHVDDPTLRKGVGFARRWGCGSVAYVNLFAYRSPHPMELAKPDDPVGPYNDTYIVQQAMCADTVVLAWGQNKYAAPRAGQVLALLARYNLYCLGRNADGSPKHPLYLPYETELVPWRAA